MQSQIERRDKIQNVHRLKQLGYKNLQIADEAGVSAKTVQRLLLINPDLLCVDGTTTRKTKRSMQPYKKQVRELLNKGYKPTQILRKLQELYPHKVFKRSTVNDLCCDIREEDTGHRSISALKDAGFQMPHTKGDRSKVHKIKRRDFNRLHLVRQQQNL
jgi:hypothetical protein